MVLNSIAKECDKYQNIGILGLSFKPDSPVTIGSPSVSLLKRIQKQVRVFDYIVQTSENLNIFMEQTPEDLINKSDCIIIMHPDKRFAGLNFYNKKVVDPWGML